MACSWRAGRPRARVRMHVRTSRSHARTRSRASAACGRRAGARPPCVTSGMAPCTHARIYTQEVLLCIYLTTCRSGEPRVSSCLTQKLRRTDISGRLVLCRSTLHSRTRAWVTLVDARAPAALARFASRLEQAASQLKVLRVCVWVSALRAARSKVTHRAKARQPPAQALQQSAARPQRARARRWCAAVARRLLASPLPAPPLLSVSSRGPARSERRRAPSSSNSSRGGLAHGVSGSSIFIVALRVARLCAKFPSSLHTRQRTLKEAGLTRQVMAERSGRPPSTPAASPDDAPSPSSPLISVSESTRA